MKGLNPPQAAAVRYIDGPLLVLAGAGSGKTSVITRKIAWLVQQCGRPASTIAAVTFTNKAAREMRERVGKLLGGEQAEGLTVSTFHQLGLRIIRSELRQLGMKPGFSIFDNQDSNTLLHELLVTEHGGAGDRSAEVQQRISAWKNDRLTPGQALASATGAADVLCARAFERYNEALRAYNAVDFDDLIQLPTLLFDDHPDVLERWQNRLRYLLVDEYQDTNSAQYHLVKQLVGVRGGLTVVGDDDQSIYAWRGARPENLAQLQADFPGLEIIKLEQNYRSTSRILKAANTLIANNSHVFDKRLWSEMGVGEPLRVLECADEQDEAEQVVAEIIDHQLRQRTRLGDYALLYRGNHQSRLLEMALQRQQLPYQISGGTSFFARGEIRDVMAYLRLLVNADDDNAFLRIANVPRRKLGMTTLEALGNCAREQGCSLTRAAAIIPSGALAPASGQQLSAFCTLLEAARQGCRQQRSVDGIRSLLRDIRYAEWLDQTSSDDEVARRRLSNVDFLLDSLQRVMREEDVVLEEAIARLMLRDLMEQQEEDRAAADSVQLLTLHASKGLEYPHVTIVGMEENLLPHRNSIEQDTIAEERRLAYVGITRARETLTLSLARKRRQFGDQVDCKPSRFLDELPADDIRWQGGEKEEPGANLSRGNATLSGLKALFD